MTSLQLIYFEFWVSGRQVLLVYRVKMLKSKTWSNYQFLNINHKVEWKKELQYMFTLQATWSHGNGGKWNARSKPYNLQVWATFQILNLLPRSLEIRKILHGAMQRTKNLSLAIWVFIFKLPTKICSRSWVWGTIYIAICFLEPPIILWARSIDDLFFCYYVVK